MKYKKLDMVSKDNKSRRVLQRRKMVMREAIRAKRFDKHKLFNDALDFVEEGLFIAKQRGTLLREGY